MTVRVPSASDEQRTREIEALVNDAERYVAVETQNVSGEYSRAAYLLERLLALVRAREQEAAELREALRELVNFLDGYADDHPAYVLSNVRRIARAALGAEQ